MLKLEAYGLSENSLKLLNSYLENRRQCIKIGNNYSEFLFPFKSKDKLCLFVLGPMAIA
jgi:site-specific recombinase XerD